MCLTANRDGKEKEAEEQNTSFYDLHKIYTLNEAKFTVHAA